MKFPPITGAIDYVDLKHYDDLVDSYVCKVSKLDGVLGIARIGSASAPGLSDIDLVVTVSDEGPWPNWDALSLRRHAVGHAAESVVAHDVFVWPQCVARQAEAFFYIDNQSVLAGQPLGGIIDENIRHKLQTLVAMDYLIHRFESLCAILLAKRTSMRNVLLYISTLRHSCNLAAEIGAIDSLETAGVVSDVNQLRQSALTGTVSQMSLDKWPSRLVRLLWQLTRSVGDLCGLSPRLQRSDFWSSTQRQVFVASDAECGIALWESSIAEQKNRWLAKYVRLAPIPSVCFAHVNSYFQNSSPSAKFLAKHFPRFQVKHLDQTDCPARHVRSETVISHWKFIRSSGFVSSSGLGYLGVGTPLNMSLKSKLINHLAFANAYLLSNQIRT